MMNSIQISNVLCPQITPHLQSQRSLFPHPSVSFPIRGSRIPVSFKLNNRQKSPSLKPVCMSRGDLSSRSGGDQEPLWKSFGKSLEYFGKKPSIEDVLRNQIDKGEFIEEGGSGGKPPRRGRGGGGGGGGGFGGFGDEESLGVLDETIQVILATLGLILMYTYIINGAEIFKLAKDYIKYLFGGKKSTRLARVLDQWEEYVEYWKSQNTKETDKYWLEKEIINTPTWWDSPEKYKQILMEYLDTHSSSDSSSDDE